MSWCGLDSVGGGRGGGLELGALIIKKIDSLSGFEVPYSF